MNMEENEGTSRQSGNETLSELIATLGISGQNVIATNASGQVLAGLSFNGIYAGLGTSYAVITPGSDGFNNASVTIIDSSNKDEIGALGLTDSGMVYGVDYSSSTARLGAVWVNGQETLLQPVASYTADGTQFIYTQSIALGGNSVGQIVGESETADGHFFTGTLWQNGTVTALAPLSGDEQSGAVSINAAGIAVGYSSNGVNSHAVEWVNGVAQELPEPSGTLASTGTETGAAADSINDVGQILGVRYTSVLVGQVQEDIQLPVLWQDGQLIDLSSYVPSGAEPYSVTAGAVNDDGQFMLSWTTAGGTSESKLITLSFDAADATNSSYTPYFTSIQVAGSAANIATDLDGLEALATAGKIASITLTDGGIPTLSLTAAQLAADGGALALVSSSFQVDVTAPASGGMITGLSGHATTVVFDGDASQFSESILGNGASLTVTGTGETYTLANVTALQFNDVTEIVASQTPAVSGAISSAQVTELYGAVFGRLPDAAGLAYYEAYAAANPATPLTQYAEWFLSSPEYTGNSAHDYAQSAAGDAQFITDCYQNLLGRTPESGAIPYYQNIINQFTAGLTPGTAAYAAAELHGHALVIAYFSQSAEFLSDVQVTAQNPASSGFSGHWLVLV